jgi:hypothetical protein
MTDALDCWKQADKCLHFARSEKDEELKALLHDMARTWRTLACQIERIRDLRDELAQYWAKMH